MMGYREQYGYTNRYKAKPRADLTGKAVESLAGRRGTIVGATDTAYAIEWEDGTSTHMTAEYFTIVK